VEIRDQQDNQEHLEHLDLRDQLVEQGDLVIVETGDLREHQVV
jgi:hypothetical protein